MEQKKGLTLYKIGEVAADSIPLVDKAKGYYDTYESLKDGDYLEAGVNAATTVLPVLGFIESKIPDSDEEGNELSVAGGAAGSVIAQLLGGVIPMNKGGLMADDMPHGCGCEGECDGSCGHGGDMSMSDYNIGHDPVSGNPVPPGSHEENVRDDIPAVLSEGEYVVPADVVRYHGLKTFMALRDEAKLGLMAMHMEGQIKTLEEEDAYYEDETELDSEELETESDVPATEDKTQEGEGELFEEGYETPEGNMVATPEPKIEEDGMLTYRPSVSFAILKS
jgi:hypothetical protein